jgi:hypothetical protein
VTARTCNLMRCLALVLALLSLAGPAAAETPGSPTGLRSPEQRSVRHSAYALPSGMWSFDVSALGVTGDELYGGLFIRRGFGAGFELELNLAHYAVGLFGIGAQWNFLETRYLALAANIGFTYGHGDWMWIAGPVAKDLLEDADLITVPVAITASSAVLSWLQLDLSLNLRYGTVWGTLGDGDTLFANAEIGAHQVSFRPGARVFVSDATALELAFDVPVYTWVPWEGDITAEFARRGYEKSGSGGAKLPTSQTWKLEGGVRSRLTPWLFCTLRLHYGRANRLLYSTTINPSLSLELLLGVRFL